MFGYNGNDKHSLKVLEEFGNFLFYGNEFLKYENVCSGL